MASTVEQSIRAEPPAPQPAPPRHPPRSIVGAIGAYFIIRIAARASYGILSTYFALRVTSSATVAAVVVTVFFISELGLAPIVGNLSDRFGRRPFLILSPICGAVASGIFALVTLLPVTGTQVTGVVRVVLVLVFAGGRLLEGISAACAAPAGLGFLADVSGDNEDRRIRVMTAFEITTVLGVVIGIPVGNLLYATAGVHGFFGVLAIYLVTAVILSTTVVESRAPTAVSERVAHERFGPAAIAIYRKLLGRSRLLAFVPAWLAVNALLAALLGLIQFLLSLPTAAQGTLEPNQKDADLRFPHQLLVGGFDQGTIAALLGTFGAMLIVGMVIWTFILPRVRRPVAMHISLGGFLAVTALLAITNRLGENPQTLSTQAHHTLWVVLPLIGISVVVASGFAPAAITHLAALSDEIPGERGAIMGLYSLLLGGGQLLGTWVGGIFSDLWGFNGLVIFGLLLTTLAFWSVHAADDHLPDHAHRDSGPLGQVRKT
ncbi:MAG: MFS transporter [Thermomicrobiales bacterium]